MDDGGSKHTLRVMEHALPAVHMLDLAELLARWNVSAGELLVPLGLSADALSAPGARLPIAMVQRVVERARALSGEPGLGFYLGLQMRISAHGYVGFAAMTSRTLGEALELACRFAPTRTTALALRLSSGGKLASVQIDERAPLGSARDVIIWALVIGLWQIGNAITGCTLAGDAELAFPEPEYFPRFSMLAPGTVRFSQPAHRLVFDASLLDLPLTMSDPAALRLALEQCDRELDALGYEGQVVTRVRALIQDEDGGFRSLGAIARKLHLSERTLKRRLAVQGTAFSTLLEEQRRERAMLLLQSGKLSVEEVADRLGYSDAANFTRAFRRWTGRTPTAFRKGHGRTVVMKPPQ